MRIVTILCCSLALSGCATTDFFGSGLNLPRTPGERSASYGYVPLDPLAVQEVACESAAEEWVPLLEALPDLAIRFAVADIDASGGLSFGPSKTTAEGGVYRAVLDYVNVEAIPVDFIVRVVAVNDSGETFFLRPSDEVLPGWRVVAFEAHATDRGFELSPEQIDDRYETVTVPVYVGVGLRLSADIRALKSNINLSGLGAIGAQAEANQLAGTLTVQTLGVNGKSIAIALPLPNKLDQTTIESGILAIGSSRAMLYTAGAPGEQVTATPRIVGLYSPIGADPRLVNELYSELSRVRPVWNRPCRARAQS